MQISEAQDNVAIEEVASVAEASGISSENVNTTEEEPDVQMSEIQEDMEIQEVQQTAEVTEVFEDIDSTETVVDNDTAISHQDLVDVAFADLHPITSITGLSDKLKELEKLKTVLSSGRGFAQYYVWNDSNPLKENRTGYFVTMVDGTDRIKICDNADEDVIGVTVSADTAGFIGGQSDDVIANSHEYGLVCLIGHALVRRRSTVNVGDYVIPNTLGVAQTSSFSNKVSMPYFQTITITSETTYQLAHLPQGEPKVYLLMEDGTLGESITVSALAADKAIAINGTSVKVIVGDTGYNEGNKLFFMYHYESPRNLGYKVTAVLYDKGVHYAQINIVPNGNALAWIEENINTLLKRIITNEGNVTIAMNRANDAYALAESGGGKSNAEIIDRLNKVEDSVQQAQDTANSAVDNATLKAEEIAGEAVLKAEELVQETKIDIEEAQKEINTANQAISDMKKVTDPLGTWENADGSVGAEYLLEYIDNDLATKAEVQVVENDVESAHTAIAQNAKEIQLMASSVQKYCVSETSQANGLTLGEAQSILPVGIVYTPTAGHTEQYQTSAGYDTQVFNRGFSYVWNGTAWEESDVENVNFLGEYLNPPAGESISYWCTSNAQITNNEEIYEANTLYQGTRGQWVKVGSLSDSSVSRIASAVRVLANELALEIVGNEQYAGIKARVEDAEVAIENITNLNTDETSALTQLKQQVTDNKADISQLAEFTYAVAIDSKKLTEEPDEGAYYATQPEWNAETNQWVFSGSIQDKPGFYDGAEYCYTANPNNKQTYLQYVCDEANQWYVLEKGIGTSLASIQSTANAASASISQVVQAVGKDGEVNAASIVTAVTEDESSIALLADNIVLDADNINFTATADYSVVAENITLRADKLDFGGDGTEEIKLDADNINFEGSEFSVSIQGSIDTAKNDAVTTASNNTDEKLKNYSTTAQTQSLIDQKADSITLSVSNTYSTKDETTEAKNAAIASANSSTDEKLKNYSTTTQTQSLIDQKADGIALSVSQTYSTKDETNTAKENAITEANSSTDEKLKSYSTTTEMNSAINQKADGITLSVSQTYSTKDETSTAKEAAITEANNSTDEKLKSYSTITEMNSAIEQKADSITLSVSQTYSTKDEVSDLETRVEEAETAIKLNEDNIELKVAKDGVISSINQTSETITINADKVNLNGYVTLTNLATDGATTINGGNITTGTIDAERIDAKNLKVDAANITGTLVIGQLPSTVAETDDIPKNTSDLNNDSGFQNETGVVTITEGLITADYIKTLNLEVGNQITMGYNATISWDNVTSKESVALKDYVSTAKSEAISAASDDATSKANAAQTNAINTASADATTKADAAKSGAISEIDGRGYQTESQVTEITETTITTKELTAEKLHVKAANIEGALTADQIDVSGIISAGSLAIKSDIDNIEIGGRNLLLGTRDPLKLDAGTNNYKYQAYTPTESLTADEDYCFSADVKISAGSPTIIVVGFFDSALNSYTLAKLPIENSHITGIIKPTTQAKDLLLVYAGENQKTAGNIVEFSNMKLEKGNKPTAWTPAPEELGGWYVDSSGVYMKDGQGNHVVGMTSTTGSCRSDDKTFSPRFYAGADMATYGDNWGDHANFLVLEDGTLYAHDVYANGYIKATDGSFAGVVDAKAGSSLGGFKVYEDSITGSNIQLLDGDSTIRAEKLYANKIGIHDGSKECFSFDMNGTTPQNVTVSVELKKDIWSSETDRYYSAFTIRLSEKATRDYSFTLFIYYYYKDAFEYEDFIQSEITIKAGSNYGNYTFQEKWTFKALFADREFTRSRLALVGEDIIWETTESSLTKTDIHTYQQLTGGVLQIYAGGHIVPLHWGGDGTGYNLGASGDKGMWNDIYAYNTTVQWSDRQAKKDIATLSDPYEQIFDALEPVSYKFKTNTSDRTHTGFIAQDVKAAVENAGLTTQDFAAYCEWTKDDGTIGCGLRYGEFIALCVNEIQKLKKRVAELEEKLDTTK